MPVIAPLKEELSFRPVTDADGAVLRGIFADARVAEWLRAAGTSGPFSDAECDQLARAGAARWVAHGFGPWVVGAGAETVAHGGLQVKVIDGRAEVELAWAVAADHWREGVATAIGRRGLALARDLGLHRVVAITRVDNEASLGVMRRLGLREQGTVMHAGLEHVLTVAPDPVVSASRQP